MNKNKIHSVYIIFGRVVFDKINQVPIDFPNHMKHMFVSRFCDIGHKKHPTIGRTSFTIIDIVIKLISTNYHVNWFEPQEPRTKMVKKMVKSYCYGNEQRIIPIFSRHEGIIFAEKRFSQNICWKAYEIVDWNGNAEQANEIRDQCMNNWVRVGDLLTKKKGHINRYPYETRTTNDDNEIFSTLFVC